MNKRDWSKQSCIIDAELDQIKAIAKNPFAAPVIIAMQYIKIQAIQQTPASCFNKNGGIDKRRHRRYLRSFKGRVLMPNVYKVQGK